MIEIIPKECVAILPLSAEPISAWNSNTDLRMLLIKMYELGGYSSHGEYLFRQGLERWQRKVVEFEENATKATPAPAEEKQTEPIPDFRNDPSFGLMAKFSIAWDGAEEAVLSESAFFSLAHVLEAGSDFEASVLLASNLYYKQALQMIRNYLEGMVLQLYFTNNLGDFEKWKAGAYKNPPLRGKNGLLNTLQNKGVLPLDLSKLASDLYDELNGSVHGAERRLVYAGVFEGKSAAGIFKYERFKEWCEYFAKCAYFGIHTLRISSNLWESRRPRGRIYCDVCHNENVALFQIEKAELDEGSWSFTCNRCGSERSYSAQWAKKLGY
jgi:hypothetical protein